jgi:hypothetical protein
VGEEGKLVSEEAQVGGGLSLEWVVTLGGLCQEKRK